MATATRRMAMIMETTMMGEMRLPFQLADFTRVIWHSERARQVWTDRLNNINGSWARIERWAVVEGARNSCLTFFEPSYLPEASQWAASHGLVCLPMAQVGITDQYSATPKAPAAGQAWQYRTVLTRPALVAPWIAAWKDTGQDGRYKGTNNQAIGELLGYPQCCIDFFERVWVREQSVDTTWAMAAGSKSAVFGHGERSIQVAGAPEANILLRWLGARLVSHLPCAFDCEPTIALAKTMAEVGRKRHFGEWIDYIYEMLSWPIEWSALHGIAEIRTPVCTISSRTNATAKKLTVQRKGERYPDEGASGLKFPFRLVKDKVTGSPAFKRSTQSVWELNGFSTQAGMEQAHETLLSTLPFTPGSILDLGCGNGRLLELARDKGWTVSGVENDNVRAGAATIPIIRGDMFDLSTWEGTWDVVVMMPGRLLENKITADQFRSALQSRARTVLLYAYGDWLQRFGGLGPLAAEAGLGGGDVIAAKSHDGVEAALVQFARKATTAVAP